MKLALVLSLLLAGISPALYPQTGDPANDVRYQLIGTWIAVSIEDHMSDGPHTPSFGNHPIGLLTYDVADRRVFELRRALPMAVLPGPIEVSSR